MASAPYDFISSCLPKWATGLRAKLAVMPVSGPEAVTQLRPAKQFFGQLPVFGIRR
jgi:hypothetical protein